MKILIIGGSRFMGPYIINELLEKDHDITVFNRGGATIAENSNIQYIKGDRNSGIDIKDYFNVVIDTCAYTGDQTARSVNELNFDYYLHISTVSVYKKSEIFPLREDTSPIGAWPAWGDYNKGKVECEQILEKSGLKYAIVRSVYILGAKNHLPRESYIYTKLKKGEELILPGNGEAIIQFVFVQDVARMVSLLVENKITGIYNCAGDDLITLNGLVSEMSKIIGVTAKIKYDYSADDINYSKTEFPFANINFFCSNDKIKKLGIKFTPLIKGLAEDFNNYYKNII